MTKEEFDNKNSKVDELINKEKDEKPSEADELINKEKDNKLSEAVEDNYKFGWNRYAEITNGRFAMIGLLAIVIIEILSKKPFFSWAGILN